MIFGKSHHEWPKKSLLTVTNALFHFLHAILCPWMHNFAGNNYWLSIPPLSLRTEFSDLALWRHHIWYVTSRERGLLGIVTSYSSTVLTRANWLKGDLHQWIATVNINFSPSGIHGLGCKNDNFLMKCTDAEISVVPIVHFWNWRYLAKKVHDIH